MSLGYGTSIVRENLLLHIDANNVKSYSGSGTSASNMMASKEVFYGGDNVEVSGDAFEYISADNASTRGYTYGPTDVKGESDLDSGGCVGLMTFQQAVEHVHGFGARLPTVDEVRRGAATGSGCGYDAQQIWTADAANSSGSKHFVIHGRTDTYGDVIQERNVTSTAYVRYVADVDTNRSDPVTIVSDQLKSILESFYSTTYSTTSETKNFNTGNDGDTYSNPTLTNGVTHQDGYFSFDGVNDYIEINRSFCSNIVGLSGNVPYTMEGWIYPTANPGDANLGASIFGTSSTYGVGLQLMYNGGLLKVNFGYRSTNNFYSTGGLNLNEWAHVVGVKDPSNSKINIYINGVLDVSYDSTELSIYSTSATLQMGLSSGRMGYFTGRIADIKLYSKALTASEVEKNFNALRGRFGI
jgi:hypothetical protein